MAYDPAVMSHRQRHPGRPRLAPRYRWGGVAALLLTVCVSAPPAGAAGLAVATVDPVPTPTACPSGQTAAPGTPGTTAPGGKPACAIAPPTPIPGPAVAPEHVVGGPALAATGVITAAGVPAPPEVSDVSYVVADLTTGTILAAKSPHALLLPASTLKTLTSLVTLPALDPAQKVVATDAEVAAEGTRVGLVTGGTYTVDDLFHGLVLISGNDTAYAIADAYGGRAKTVAAMNAKAAALGAWDTVAVDPSGLDTDGQRSSAYDLALIGRAVMQLPAYQKIAVTPTYTFPGATDAAGTVHPAFQIQNHNALLENYPGAVGVKNGYTTGARQTFIGAATRGGHTLLITQMGGTDVPSWKRAAALLDWGFAHLDAKPVGTLVAPGAPQPPELGGPTPSPTSTAAPTSPTTSAPPTAGGSTSAAAVPPGSGSQPAAAAPVAPVALSAGGNPVPGLVDTARTVGTSPPGYAAGLLLVLATAGWLVARRRRRHT